MSDSLYYLKANAKAEPLVNQWYAWPMLIAPVTNAMVTANLHLPIMESYINSPKIHDAAAKNPAMRGGPFVNFKGVNRIPEVTELVDNVKNKLTDLLQLAQSLKNLDLLLLEADGFSLQSYYAKIDSCLKGYIELVYDLRNNAFYRLIEPLFYNSDYYKTQNQQFMLSLLENDDRPFVLSTPRIPGENDILWQTPFAAPQVDNFFKFKYQGIALSELKNFFDKHLASQGIDYNKFELLFTTQKPERKAEHLKYTGNNVRIRYFGHACVLIETAKTTILIDPLVSYFCPEGIERYTFDSLPEHIDYVILSHSHQDHVMFETLFQIRHKIGTFVVPKNLSGAIQDPSLKLMFQALGFNNVIELNEFDCISFSDGKITGVTFFGEHGDLNVQSKIAYCITVKDKNILFIADSNNLAPEFYHHAAKILPKIDVIFLGMECDGAPMSWLYGPLYTTPLSRVHDQSRRLDGSDCEKALDLINTLGCKQVYVYAMGQEPWLGYITSISYTAKSKPILESNKLIEEGQKLNIQVERPYCQQEIHLN